MFIHFEEIEARRLFAVTAFFVPGLRVLSVLGDSQDNTITISRNNQGAKDRPTAEAELRAWSESEHW